MKVYSRSLLARFWRATAVVVVVVNAAEYPPWQRRGVGGGSGRAGSGLAIWTSITPRHPAPSPQAPPPAVSHRSDLAIILSSSPGGHRPPALCRESGVPPFYIVKRGMPEDFLQDFPGDHSRLQLLLLAPAISRLQLGSCRLSAARL